MSSNDDAIIGAIWTRRQAMKMGLGSLIGGSMAATFLGRASAADTAASALRPSPTTRPLVASPAITEGPFFVDERLNRSNLLAGTTRPAVVNGTPLQLNLSILRLDASGNASPLTGAQIDVWHCDTAGAYSDEDNPMNVEVTSGQRWLRGYQLVDTAGRVRFSTIVPGWYDGRTAHIHFKVRQFSPAKKQTADFTSQFFFAEATLDRIFAAAPYDARGQRTMRNADDGIFSEKLTDGSTAGSHQMLALKPAATGGYETQFTIVVTDASLHAPLHDFPGGPGGGRGGGPPGGPGGGPPGPPPGDGFGPPPM